MEKDFNLFIRDDLDGLSETDVDRMLTLLPSWRCEQALRFKHLQGRKECACAYLLLCEALKEVYGVDEQPAFSIGEHGKPALLFSECPDTQESLDAPGTPLGGKREGIHFNLSHCKHAVACVVADHPVGVDVECLGRYSESLARHVLNDWELEHVLSVADPDAAFTRLWTQKEAIVKLTGRGIDNDLKNLLLKYNHVSLHTEEHLDKGYVVTVATYATQTV